ncbi:MAG TPA: aminotransferase class III-fold pyridoxal phosphate-dependent enzyme [Acidimicrobiales bacterium]
MGDRILDEYLRRTPASAAAAARAERVMPGGDTRAAGWHPPYPLMVVRGAGPILTDADGNDHWDLSGNFTSLAHGHAYPPIVEAAGRAMADGTAWPARNAHQVALAERLVERVASVERVRFCNSGSEAAMLALNVARLATGRPGVLMARFGYHGSHEAFEAGTFPERPHVPGADHTLLADHGDAGSFERALADHGDEVAAVFLETVMGVAGIVAPPPGFLDRVAAAARRAGALLVLDEVIAFRLATGGAQSIFGASPDLTLFGKVVGGGFPVGAVGGRADVMALLDPSTGRLFHSGTFNGNPVTCAAGLVSVDHLTPDRIDAMAALAERLERGLAAGAAAAGLPFSDRRCGSLLNVWFLPEPPPPSARRDDDAAMTAFHLAGMNHGLYFASRGMLALSTVMDEAAVDEIVERAGDAMADVAAAVPAAAGRR